MLARARRSRSILHVVCSSKSDLDGALPKHPSDYGRVDEDKLDANTGVLAALALEDFREATGKATNWALPLTVDAARIEKVVEKRIDYVQPHGNVADRPEIGEKAGRAEPGSWRTVTPTGQPLRGWDDILKALGGKKGRKAHVELSRQNAAEDGPICIVRGRPEVHEPQLRAWIADIEGRAFVAEQRRNLKAATLGELGERKGARLPDHKLHTERRPNARGKDRPSDM